MAAGPSANVSSIDAIRDLRSAVVQFGGDASNALTMLILQARKAMLWLQNDRARYWPDQLRKAQNRVVQAQNDLDRCQMHLASEDAPSCFDQKKALEKAKRRLRTCEEKAKAVKRWITTIRQELDEFDGELAKMTNWLESDLPRATASLERMLRALDKYALDIASLNEPQSNATNPKANGEDHTASGIE